MRNPPVSKASGSSRNSTMPSRSLMRPHTSPPWISLHGARWAAGGGGGGGGEAGGGRLSATPSVSRGWGWRR